MGERGLASETAAGAEEQLRFLDERMSGLKERIAALPEGDPERARLEAGFERLSKSKVALGSAAAKTREQVIRAEPFRKSGQVVIPALGGVTLGLSDVVLSKLNKEAGVELTPQSTGEQVVSAVSRMLGTIFTSHGVAGGMKNLVGRYGLQGAKQMLAMRALTSLTTAGTSSLSRVMTGEADAGRAVTDTLVSVGASMFGMLPETFVKSGLGNFFAQIAADFAYDLATDTARGRLKDRTFMDWFIKDELIQLAPSIAFAARDLGDKKFEADRIKTKNELISMFKRDAQKAGFDLKAEAGEQPRAEAIAQQKQVEAKIKPAPQSELDSVIKQLNDLTKKNTLDQRVQAKPDQAKALGDPEELTLRGVAKKMGLDIKDKAQKAKANDQYIKDLREAARSIGVSDKGMPGVVKSRINLVRKQLDILSTSADPIEKLNARLEISRLALPVTTELASGRRSEQAATIGKLMDQFEGQEGTRRANASLRGQLPFAQEVPVSDFFSRAEIDTLTKRVGELAPQLKPFERLAASNALAKIGTGERLQKAELKMLGKIFGNRAAAQLGKVNPAWKAYDAVINATGVLRTAKTMMDASAIARQGAIVGLANPKEAAGALKKMGQGWFNEERYEQLHDAITSDPRHALAKQSGLYIAPKHATKADFAEREEAFMSDFSEKIPGARLSERAFNGFLNSLRADVFYKFVDKWGDTATLAEYKKLASWLNKATGRGGFEKGGRLGYVEKAMPLLSTGFFSPRWVLSRIQTPLEAITPVYDKELGRLRFSRANMEGIRSLATYYGLLATVLTVAKAAGADIEEDPRSSDFAKVKVGNTRFDLSAGTQQMVRTIAQFIKGEKKNLRTGRVTEADRGKLIGRFFRSKLAPAPSLLLSAITGKTFVGDEFWSAEDEETAKIVNKKLGELGVPDRPRKHIAAGAQFTQRELVPLVFQAVIEAMQTDDPLVGLLAGAGEFIGVGTTSFDEQKRRSRRGRGRKRRGR